MIFELLKSYTYTFLFFYCILGYVISVSKNNKSKGSNKMEQKLSKNTNEEFSKLLEMKAQLEKINK